jgi:hypothetical protein
MESRDPNSQFASAEGERPRIAATKTVSVAFSQFKSRDKADFILQKSKYKVGRKVYLDESGSRSLSGPYLIASVLRPGKYTLCLENGDKVKDGAEVDEEALIEAESE